MRAVLLANLLAQLGLLATEWLAWANGDHAAGGLLPNTVLHRAAGRRFCPLRAPHATRRLATAPGQCLGQKVITPRGCGRLVRISRWHREPHRQRQEWSAWAAAATTALSVRIR